MHCQLCPMSYAESHALYATKVSKTYHSTLCYTSVERYMYISYWHFGKPSLGNFNSFSLTFTYLIPSILFLVCTLKPRVPSNPEGSIHNDSSETPRISTCFCCWREKTKSVHFNFLTDAYFILACRLHENVTKKTLI